MTVSSDPARPLSRRALPVQRLRRAVLILLAGVLPAAFAQAVADPWQAAAGEGVAIMLRHAATESGIGDPPGFRLDDCTTQRNLSAAGRAQAARFGAALAERRIRIDEVRSSQWCRCLDTARLAFPALAVRADPMLNSFFQDRSAEPAQTAALRAYLKDLGRRRVVLVTHQFSIAALTGESVSMGEAVVVTMRNGEPRVLARLRVD
jgi:broad specificity phosphatase PhoE